MTLDIKKLLDYTESELYESLANLAIDQKVFRSEDIRQDRTSMGQNIFMGYLSILKSRICGDTELRTEVSSGTEDALIKAIDKTSSIVGPYVIPGSAELIAVIIFKQGIEKLCD